VQRNGKQAVLGWLSDGLPADLFRSSAGIPALTPHNRADKQPLEKPQ